MPLKPDPTVFRPFICSKCRTRSRHSFQRQLRNFATSTRLSAAATTASKYLRLQNRTVVRLAGPDATVFLNDLVPAKILDAGSRCPIYTVFLSPHGRLLNDVFIYPPGADNGEEWLIEVDSGSADSLVKHLRKHKLRAKFKMERLNPEEFGVYYRWPRDGDGAEVSSPSNGALIGGKDPRPGMGLRWLGEATSSSKPDILQRLEDGGAQNATMEDYTVHRMLNGIAEGQDELIATASLPQESNVDFFGGIDFHKGCYVGQELTIRTHHTGVVRKRILPCQLYEKSTPPSADQRLPEYIPDSGLPSPAPGSNISKLNARGRGRSSGKWLGGVGNIGLALCRLEMMTDIQLTADRTNYDPNEQYKVLWGAEGEGQGQQEVMLQPFVPLWLREGVEQNLRRKDKKPKPRQEEDDEEDDEDVD